MPKNSRLARYLLLDRRPARRHQCDWPEAPNPRNKTQQLTTLNLEALGPGLALRPQSARELYRHLEGGGQALAAGQPPPRERLPHHVAEVKDAPVAHPADAGHADRRPHAPSERPAVDEVVPVLEPDAAALYNKAALTDPAMLTCVIPKSRAFARRAPLDGCVTKAPRVAHRNWRA